MREKLNWTNFLKSNHSFGKKVLVMVSIFMMCFHLDALAQTMKNISGQVIDNLNEPLIGVNVFIKGTTRGAITDIDGNYAIEASKGEKLVFSYIGMDDKAVVVGDQSIINVQLLENTILLEETVVIGYGSAKKRDLTGSIVSVDSKQIANRPGSNAAASLQGKVAGLQVVNSGRPGQDPEIRIRGTNSINGYKPLYVVDGLFTDNINHINAADIDKVEILKDASSLAVFGIAGANGVIIVSTKKAKEGSTTVNVNSTMGFKYVGDRINMTNASQFKELYTEQLVNQGAKPFDYTNWQADTDWQKAIFQTGFVTQNNVSISSANDKGRFYMGVGYDHEEGSIIKEKMSRVTVNLKSDFDVTDKIRFGFQFNGSRTLPADAKDVEGALKAAPISPMYGSVTNADGVNEKFPHQLPSFQNIQVWNPLIKTDVRANHNKAANYRGAGNIYGEVDFLNNFAFKATFTYDFASNNSRMYTPLAQVYNPETKNIENLTEREVVTQAKSTDITAMSDYILTYKNDFGKHGITATAGITTRYNENSGIDVERSQHMDETLFHIPNNDPDKWWITSLGTNAMKNNGSQWKKFTMSYLLRGLYNYDNKYLLNLSYRRDGSSVFKGAGKTWGNFYSVGAGWVMSEESFMKDIEVIDYLKLKGSWGVLGSDAVADRRYPTYPALVGGSGAVFGDYIYPSFSEEYLVSADDAKKLGWEKTYSWEAGFDLKMFNQRLQIEPVFYNKETRDIIILQDAQMGAKNSLVNNGIVRNRGVELAASWRDEIGHTGLYYTLGANLTTINNKVLSIGSGKDFKQTSGMSVTQEGYPIGYFYGYDVVGVYQSQDEIAQSPTNKLATVNPGDLKFRDVNGDGIIDANDRTMIGNPTPDFTYGFNIAIDYKGFDLSVDMMGVSGNDIYRNWDISKHGQFNYLENKMDRWRGEGTSNWEPILDPSRSINIEHSSYFVESGSFFRIKNIQLGYTFSPKLLQKVYLKSLRLFANVDNLKTWSSASGYTPEIGGSAISFGVDNGTYPMPTIYTFGFNLSF